MAKYDHQTTYGWLQYTNNGDYVLTQIIPDPEAPDNSGDWKLVGSVLGEMRQSQQVILWFWEREHKERKVRKV